MLEIKITSNIKEISKKLSALAYKELPFATARALTELAREVQQAERAGMESVFDRPKGFTLDSVKVFGATKDNLTGGVFVMDRAANYLNPFEDGGQHFIASGRGDHLLGPVQAPKTQYGGLPRGYVARHKGQANMFVGVVQTRQGPINGLWQRTKGASAGNARRAAFTTGYRGKQSNGRTVKGLRLMVRFVANQPVKQHLGFHERAERLVNRRFEAVLGRELAKAIARSGFK